MGTCGDCKFFIPEPAPDPPVGAFHEGEAEEPDDPGGTCHEDSPKAAQRGQMVEDGDNEVIWPWVASDDWCGKWKKV